MFFPKYTFFAWENYREKRFSFIAKQLVDFFQTSSYTRGILIKKGKSAKIGQSETN